MKMSKGAKGRGSIMSGIRDNIIITNSASHDKTINEVNVLEENKDKVNN